MKKLYLETPLGSMLAIASHTALYLLEFADRTGLAQEVIRLQEKTQSVVSPGSSPILLTLKEELNLYFEGRLQVFKTPLCLLGSPFQQQVWTELQNLPLGATRSYLQLAQTIERPTACRAVAQANRTNQLAIIVPCHRVINHNGQLSGYAGGVHRKAALLEHEHKVAEESKKN